MTAFRRYHVNGKDYTAIEAAQWLEDYVQRHIVLGDIEDARLEFVIKLAARYRSFA